jgi:regulator of protease activity HflC (stomatin/prohibitin superfamily)
MLGPVSVAYMILSFHHAHGLAQGLKAGHSEPRDANPPEDVARREVKHAFDEKMWAQRERERENVPRAPLNGR